MPLFLLIDAGNSRVKWQVCQKQSQGGFDVITTDVVATEQLLLPNQPIDWFRELSSKYPTIQHVVVASVLGLDWLQGLRHAVGSVPLLVPRVQACSVLSCPYYHNQQLGIDRWLGCLALATESTFAVNLMVSFGTATTVDAVVQSSLVQQTASRFVHLGGFIAPGVDLMMRSLSSATQQLPQFEFQAQDQAIWPTSTRQAICMGVQLAQQSVLENAIRLLHLQWPNEQVVVWVAGGAYSWFNLESLGCQVILIPNAVFKGLQQCLNLNL